MDIATGGEVVLSGGNLGRAMRASMSVPSIFAPIEIDDKILVDGGIVNNLPVNVARGMGADVLIAVDIGSPLRTKNQISNLLEVTDQLTRILTGRNAAASKRRLRPGDILILPDLGDITATQFDRSAEAIPTGEAAARAMRNELRALSLDESAYRSYRAGLDQLSSQDRTVKRIDLANTSSIGDNVIEERIDVPVGAELSLDQLDRDVGQIYGIGVFEKVGYDLYQHQDGVDVGIYATPKSWGPNYLHFGVSVDGDFRGDNGSNLILGYSRTGMNNRAGEWTTLLQIGEEPEITSYFHQPLGLNLKFFVQPYVSLQRTNVGVFSDDDKLAEYRLYEDEVEFLVGREFATKAVLALGVNRISGEARVLIGDPALPEAEFDDGGAIVQFRYDTLDDIDFPTRGGIVRASYYKALDSLGADQEYEQWRIRTGALKSFGKHTVGFGATLGGTEDGTASLSRRFLLGGFLNMSGLRRNQQSGEYLGLIQAVYFRKFDRIKFLPAYVGGTAEYGGVWQNRNDIGSDSSLFGGSLFLGLDSPLGPVLLGWGYTEGGDSVFFTKVGRFFN